MRAKGCSKGWGLNRRRAVRPQSVASGPPHCLAASGSGIVPRCPMEPPPLLEVGYFLLLIVHVLLRTGFSDASQRGAVPCVQARAFRTERKEGNSPAKFLLCVRYLTYVHVILIPRNSAT